MKKEIEKNSQNSFKELLDYLLLFGDTNFGVFRSDVSLSLIQIATDSMAKLLGYTLRKFRKISFHNHFNSQSTLKAFLNLLQKDGFVKDFQAQFKRSDGSIIWGILSARLNPEQSYLDCLFIDFSEKKEIEKELLESKERFTLLCEATFEAIILHDQGKILEANSTFVQEFGYSDPSQIIGRHISEFVSTESYESLLRCISLECFEPCKGIAIRKDKSAFPCEFSGKEIPYQGRTINVLSIRNIVEKKRIKNALHERNLRYVPLFEETNDVIFFIDMNLKYIDANQQTANMLCHPVSEMIGMDAMTVIAPEEREEVIQRFTDLKAGKKLPLYKRHFINKEGVRYPVEINATLIYDNEGNPAYIQSIVRDISQRIEVEQKLSLEKNRLQKYLEIANFIVVILDTDKKILSINNKGCEILLSDEKELLGKNWCEIFYTPEDLEEMDLVFEKLEQSDIHNLKMSFVNKKGETHIIIWNFYNFINERTNQREEIICYGTDITDIKKAEVEIRRLVKVVEQASNGIAIADLDGFIQYANKSWVEMHGYGSESLVGEHLSIFHTKEQLEKQVIPFNKILLEKGINQGEMGHKKKNGTIFHTWLNCLVLRDENDVPRAFVAFTHDITKRKQAEEALQEREEKYSYLFQYSSDAIFLFDLKGSILDVNQRALELFGYSKSDMSSLTIFDLHSIDFVKDSHTVFEMISQNVFMLYETNFMKKNGELFSAEVSVNLFKFDKEQVIHGIIRDISIRKMIEDERAKRIGDLTFLSDSVMDFITLPEQDVYQIISNKIKNLAGNAIVIFSTYDELNDTFTCKSYAGLGERTKMLFNLIGRDLIGLPTKPVGDYFNDLLKGKIIKITTDFNKLTNGFITKGANKILNNFLQISNNYSVGFIRKGKLIGVTSIIMLKRDDLQNKELIEVFVNQTSVALLRKEALDDLQKSELKYRTLIEQLLEGVVIAQADPTKLVFANPTLERILGYTSNELTSLSPDKILELIHPDDRKRFFGYFSARISGKPAPEYYEFRGVKKDGSIIWLGISARRIVYGDEPAVLAAFTDISEQKHIQEELYRLNLELEQRVTERTEQLQVINKELEAFSYSVSHDLRAPLRRIIGFNTLLKECFEKGDDEKVRLFISKIDHIGVEMNQLINDLLTFSQLVRKELVMDSIYLEKLVNDIINELKPEVKYRTIVWKVKKIVDVYGDISLIRLVMINLISNALKFTKHKSKVIIEIGSELSDNEVIVYVKDNGVGFDMTYHDKLFEAFSRLHQKEDFEGSGVGLANVQRIICRHEGTVWAKGEVDKGATFYFSLPNREL